METEKITTAIYAQHCVAAGKVCRDEEMIEAESDDIRIFKGTESELSAIADNLEKYASPNADGAYARSLAAAIRAEIGVEK